MPRAILEPEAAEDLRRGLELVDAEPSDHCVYPPCGLPAEVEHPDGFWLSRGLSLTGNAGGFDFLPLVFKGLTKTQVSWRISDHLPLRVEFKVAPSRTSDPAVLQIGSQQVEGYIRGLARGEVDDATSKTSSPGEPTNLRV